MQPGKIVAVIIAIIVVGIAGYFGIQHFGGSGSSPIIVYSADAYVQETNHYLNGFHNSSGVPVASAKGAGSYTAAREIGQGDPANAFISVALESYNQSYLGQRYSGWAVAFASDQLVLAYSNNSGNSMVSGIAVQFASALSSHNATQFGQAYENLTSGRVKLGISDPGSDPAGLRGWISLEIAGKLYGGGNLSYYTSRLVVNNGVVNSSSAAQLVSPLVTGQIQFLFIYKSAAISKGLDYITLPPQVNFGDPNLTSYYSGFTYSTETGVGHGSIIMLYVSALAGNGAMSGASVGFVTYVLNHSIDMSEFGLKPLPEPVLYNNTLPPSMIRDMVSSGEIASGGRF